MILSILTGFLWHPAYNPRVWSADFLPSQTGSVERQFRVAEEGRDKAGFLTFGPYVVLPSGDYTVAIDYSCSAPASRGVGTWDVYANSGARVIAQGAILGTNGQNGTITAPFRIRDHSHEAYEFRVYWSGSGTFKVFEVRLKAIPG